MVDIDWLKASWPGLRWDTWEAGRSHRGCEKGKVFQGSGSVGRLTIAVWESSGEAHFILEGKFRNCDGKDLRSELTRALSKKALEHAKRATDLLPSNPVEPSRMEAQLAALGVVEELGLGDKEYETILQSLEAHERWLKMRGVL